MAESFGRYLRRERQMREIPLEQIARETKIKFAILDALENDRLEFLPSHAIVKGFLRAYAKILGLSGHSLVLRYESFLDEQASGVGRNSWLRSGTPKKPRRFGAIVWLLLLLLVVGFAGGLYFWWGGDSDQVSTERAAPEEVAEPELVYRKNYLRDLNTGAPPATPPNLTAAGAARVGFPGGGLNLLFQAITLTQVRVVLDSGAPEEIEMAPGQSVIRHAFRAAVIETDHPDRIIVQVNGESLPLRQTTGGRLSVGIRAIPGDRGAEAPAGLPSRFETWVIDTNDTIASPVLPEKAPSE